jgi:DNA-binding transcriptional MerR regulator
MRLDDLARRAGVASTTVRLYQSKGLLPGPRLVGRTGWYGPQHLTRLGLIARLRDQGFSLAGIGRLLSSWEQGRDLAELVGVEEQLDALLGGADDVVLTADELLARFPTDTVGPEAVERAVRLGLLEPTDDGRLRVPDRRFLEAGTALADLAIPVDELLDEWEALVTHTDEIASRFVALFRRHLAPPGLAAPGSLEGLDPTVAAELADTLARLRQEARRVLVTAFDASLARRGAESLAGLAPAGPVGPVGPDG